MIDDHVLAIVDAQAAAHCAGFVAAAKPQIADNAIVGGHSKRLPAEADSIARGGLAGDRYTRVLDFDFGVELDRAGDGKDDSSGAFGIDRFAQAARAVIIQRGDFVDFPAAAAGRGGAEALRAWKGWQISG